ncbi:MAG: hypothetical protein RLZZ546_1968 [Bacteroidota bacterium]|jgi:hypothetical protein
MFIKEDLLYYIWQSKKLNLSELKTIDGQKVEILQYGSRNFSSGPDFANAKIQLDDIIWVGHVEMHVYTSDWNKHGHGADAAYKNVILHVVFENDIGPEKTDIPILELKNYIDTSLLLKYQILMKSSTWIPCENQMQDAIKSKDGFSIWSHALTIERLERKISTFEMDGNIDWEDLLYKQIAKYFGANQNKEVFLNLAHYLPLNIILKNIHQPFIVEALVMGVAGYLDDDDSKDEYHQSLISEFNFQKKKYNLKTINKVAWKNFGMYAPGLPTYRLSQFSGLMQNASNLFSNAFQAKELGTIRKILSAKNSEYWHHHFTFGKKVNKKNNGDISDEFKDRIIINAIIPVLFSYAKYLKNEDKASEIIELFCELKPENNAITSKWKSKGLLNENAIHSQALLELKTEYCDKKKCLSCKIGVELMKIN